MLKQRMLITNDDGIHSPGLAALIKTFSPDFNLTVIAPKEPQSAKGMSHAHGNVWVTTNEESHNGITWITVDNSPTTCVSVALRSYNIKPDIIVSGINFGENLGLNLFYSGTIGAAWEGAMSGVLSLASSLELPPDKHFNVDNKVDFTSAASITKKVVESLLISPPKCKLWNLNIPQKANSATELKKCTLASQRWNYPIIREQKSVVVKDRQIRFEFDPTEDEHSKDTDIYNLRKGYATLSEIALIHFPWS